MVLVIIILVCQKLYNSGLTIINTKILETSSAWGIQLISKEPYTVNVDTPKNSTLNNIDTLILKFKPSHFSAFNNNLKEPISIELNSCDSIQLTCINGIGPATASRIIKYRNRLGGFVSKFQLFEVKYFDSSLLLDRNTEWLIDTSKVVKTEISESNIKALYRHPYIGKDLTIRLLAYKKFHKKITHSDFSQMQTIAPIQRKILPLYLKFDHSLK